MFADSGVGAGIDSYYEYLMKAYILLGDNVFLERFNIVSPPSLRTHTEIYIWIYVLYSLLEHLAILFILWVWIEDIFQLIWFIMFVCNSTTVP